MDIKEIKAIIDLMKKNDLSVFKMENEGLKLTLKMNCETGQIAASSAPAPAPAAAPAPPAAAASQPAARTINSPMVGTFYRASTPEAPPYIDAGQTVTPDTVVCIIEAMKVMNEIKAETSGTIAEVMAENGKPVQFGEPLFLLK